VHCNPPFIESGCANRRRADVAASKSALRRTCTLTALTPPAITVSGPLRQFCRSVSLATHRPFALEADERCGFHGLGIVLGPIVPSEDVINEEAACGSRRPDKTEDHAQRTGKAGAVGVCRTSRLAYRPARSRPSGAPTHRRLLMKALVISGVLLAALTAVAAAQPPKLSDAQMDGLTAGNSGTGDFLPPTQTVTATDAVAVTSGGAGAPGTGPGSPSPGHPPSGFDALIGDAIIRDPVTGAPSAYNAIPIQATRLPANLPSASSPPPKIVLPSTLPVPK
jgi:hypothetical protein